MSKVAPHVYQGNIWSLMFDPALMQRLHSSNVLFQAYNVVAGVIANRMQAPRAFAALQRIGSLVATEAALGSSSDSHSSVESNVDNQHNHGSDLTQGSWPTTTLCPPATLVLAYLNIRGIGVVPRSSRSDHRAANSPGAVLACARALVAYAAASSARTLDRSALVGSAGVSLGLSRVPSRGDAADAGGGVFHEVRLYWLPDVCT